MKVNVMTKAEMATILRKSSSRCPECGSIELITDEDSGEVVCAGCGLVLSDVILDQTPEWRAFTPEEKNAKIRVGSPTTLQHFDKGLSTTFQPYTDTRGKSLKISERFKMMRLRKWQIRANRGTSILRNLSQAMNTITFLSNKLNIPNDVAENAAQIYRKALDEGLVRGRSIDGIATAALYAACRLTRVPRSLNAVVKASNINRKVISRDYRLIRRSLNLNMPIDDPEKYLSKISSKAGVSPTTENIAIQLLEKAREKQAVVSKDPRGVAAAALYIANIMNSEEKMVTQKKLAEAAEVTEVTVRNRHKGLIKSLGLYDLSALTRKRKS